jgi:hypothetical protein
MSNHTKIGVAGNRVENNQQSIFSTGFRTLPPMTGLLLTSGKLRLTKFSFSITRNPTSIAASKWAGVWAGIDEKRGSEDYLVHFFREEV